MSRHRELLQSYLDQGEVAFFGGAGVSTASGIPDFRSANGVFAQQAPYPPEQMVSIGFFEAHTEEFYRFYRQGLVFPDARPNAAHDKLAQLEALGKMTGIVTQNIDGLHQAAGSRKVHELHGSVHRNYCISCHKAYGLEFVLESAGIPTCSCGGTVRPDVVLYGEYLDDRVVGEAVKAIQSARTLVIGGTSLVVYPAAGFVEQFRGEHLVIINQSPTPQDGKADLLIQENIAEVFDGIPL